MTSTFTIDGQKIRTQSQRRYVVVIVRQPGTYKVWVGSEGGYVDREVKGGAEIIYRTDVYGRAVARVAKYGRAVGGRVVVVDTTTGCVV